MLPKKLQKRIALERINILFENAIEKSNSNILLSNRYVALARKLSTRYKVRIPSEYRKLFCRKCSHFLIPGKNLRIRAKKKKIIYYCENCKSIRRKPFTKKT